MPGALPAPEDSLRASGIVEQEDRAAGVVVPVAETGAVVLGPLLLLDHAPRFYGMLPTGPRRGKLPIQRTSRGRMGPTHPGSPSSDPSPGVIAPRRDASSPSPQVR